MLTGEVRLKGVLGGPDGKAPHMAGHREVWEVTDAQETQ